MDRQTFPVTEETQSSQPRTTSGRVRVFYAMLGSALVWFAHFNLMYFLVQPVCRLGGEVWFHIATVVAIALTALAGYLAWSLRSPSTSMRDLVDGDGDWTQFVALFGMAAAVLFAYAIVYQWSPVVTVDVCSGMRPLP